MTIRRRGLGVLAAVLVAGCGEPVLGGHRLLCDPSTGRAYVAVPGLASARLVPLEAGARICRPCAAEGPPGGSGREADGPQPAVPAPVPARPAR